MTDELRQAVARAICDYMAVDPDFLDGDGNPYWMEYTGEADAAISVIREALAEPTQGMLAAPLSLGSGYRPMLTVEWQAALAASPLADDSDLDGAGER